MKLNGKNLITSDDITMVGDAANLGNNLDDILVSQLEEILKLKSNVKWLYKYGGVGSGSGSSSGSGNQTWAAIIAFGNQTVSDGGTIVLSNQGSYSLSVSISNPQGREFTLRYKLGDGRYTSTYKLNGDNTWNQELPITISKNTTLAVEIRDPNNEILLNTVNIIAQAYKFEAYITLTDGTKYTDSSLFISDILSKGLWLEVPYNIVVDYDECSLAINFNNRIIDVQIEDAYNTLRYNLVDMIPDLSDDNAGLYRWSMDVNLKLKSNLNTETISTIYLDLSLVPEDFYALVTPVSGTIYKEPLNYDSAEKYANNTINLNVLLYNGKVNSGKSYNITVDVSVDGVQSQSYTTTLLERKNSVIQVNGSQEGEYEVTISYSTVYTKRIYLYVYDKYKDVNYYDDGVVIQSKYYRTGINDSIDLCDESQYKVLANSSDYTIDNLEISNYSGDFATLVHFGVKFSKINSLTDKLFTINGASSNIIIYPNLVESDNAVKDFTINKCDNFNTNVEDYHLITVCWHKIDSDKNSIYYEKTVYIDGVLEAAWSNISEYYFNIESITLHPANYYLNLLEVDYIENLDYNNIDVTVVNFYNAYVLKKLLDESSVDTNILNVLKEYPYKIENNTVILNSSAVSNISQYSKIPTIVIQIPYSTQESVYKECGITFNMESFLYNMGDAGNKYPTFSTMKFISDIYYALPGEDVLSDVCNTTKKFNLGTELLFYFRFLGSSTFIFDAKNLAVGILNTSVSDTVSSIPVFTPNFSESDTSAFLPETEFNLKADVVDSSHSNNNACGRFINSEMPRLFTDVNYEYNNYVKNCLEGFPVLVILNFKKETGESSEDYYLLGQYNFNLSRESYFNLGYADLTTALEGQSLEEGFGIYNINCSTRGDILLKDELWVAEVQENTAGFDFSQYDKTVLFPTDTATLKDTGAMFGDFVYSGLESDFLDKLQSFVKATTKAGAYVFTLLEKNFGNFKELYSATVGDTDISKNLVPDYKKQYTRNIAGYLDYSEVEWVPTNDDLTLYISGKESTNTQPIVDYESLVYSYTGIMSLGLVDSILKNSNWKSWGNTTKAAFYDMDSCFGLNNAGTSDVDFKAFSDYWKPNIDENGNVLSTTIYRDYNPSFGYSGFDIPSSYVWAIAKYASSVNEDYASTLLDPQKLWYKWRNETVQFDNVNRKGPFYTADDFIDNFYKNHTKNIDPIIKNLNYRFKYFKLEDDHTFNSLNFSSFNGTRVEYVRDWIDNRLHFLDMCFNLQGVAQPILKCDPETGVYTNTGKYYNNTVSTSANEDVIVCRDIFSKTGQDFKINGYDFAVTASNYSPLVITTGESSEQYLLEDINTTYSFYKLSTGLVTAKFGGSSNWQTINDVGSFVSNGSLYLNSLYLQRVQCSSATVNNVTLNTPSLKEITFAGNLNASATLTFTKDTTSGSSTDNYPNLTTIDISGSKVSLVVNGEGVQNINIGDVNSKTISIINCDDLKVLNYGTTMQIENFTISYGDSELGKNVTFNNLKITNYDLSINKNQSSGSYIKISNDSSVKSISLSGYETVVIDQCSKLKSLTLDPTVKSLTVTNCYGSFEFTTSNFLLSGFGIFDFNGNGTIDLSKLVNLENINFGYTRGFYKVILPNKSVNLPSNCFRSTYLRYLDGGPAIISGSYVFYNAILYLMKQSDNNYSNLSVNTNDLSCIFGIDNDSSYAYTSGVKDYCKLTKEAVLYFLDNYIPDSRRKTITNLNYLFFNRGIEYKLSDSFADYLKGTSAIIFDNFPACTSAIETLGRNYIDFWNKYMFTDTFGSSNGINMLGFLLGLDFRGYYITYDSYETIASKVSAISAENTNSLLTGIIKVLNDTKTQLQEVSLNSIFLYKFNKLTTLYNFSIDATTIDFDNAFINTPNITSITYFFRNGKIATNFDGAFYCLKKLNKLSNRSLNINSSSTAVDLWKLLDWEAIIKNNNNSPIFFESYRLNSEATENSNFPRYITREDYVKLWTLILNSKMTSVNSLFRNCTLSDSNDATLPEGLTNSTITSMYATYYGFKGLNGESVYFDLNLFKKITYTGTINLFRCFLNTTWATAIPFNFFNTRVKNENIITVGEDTQAKLISYSYNTRKFNLAYCFSGSKFDINYFDDEESVTPNKIVEVNGTVDSTELLDPTTGLPYTTYTLGGVVKIFTLNTEYSDLKRLTTLHLGSPRNHSVSIESPKLFVSPDIVYNNEDTYSNMFYNSNLCGYIPWNMNKNCKSVIFSNAFYGLDILPYRIYRFSEDSEEGIFLFVPDSFTTLNTLSQAFNFRMRIPEYTTGSSNNSIYLVCSLSSIGTISIMLSAMPVANMSDRNIFMVGSTGGNPGDTILKVDANYNFMGKVNIITNEDNTVTYSVDYGIPASKLTSTNYSNMFDNYTTAITTGYMVGTTINASTNISTGYMINALLYISSRIKLPKYTEYNSKFMSVSYTTTISTSMLTDSNDASRYNNITNLTVL